MTVIEPSRKRPRAGDLFVVRMANRWIAGRVIHLDCRMMSHRGGNEPLLYFYNLVFEDPFDVRPPLRPTLLIAPIVTNMLGWRYGYFKTIANFPLQPEERLPRHYFLQSVGLEWDHPKAVFCDEFQIPAERPPPGQYWTTSGLASYRYIDDRLSEAVGIQPVPEEDEVFSETTTVATSRASVAIMIPVADLSGHEGVEHVEVELIRAVQEGGVGKWEGHGMNLETSEWDIRFSGSDADALTRLTIPVLRRLKVTGAYIVKRSANQVERVQVLDL